MPELDASVGSGKPTSGIENPAVRDDSAGVAVHGRRPLRRLVLTVSVLLLAGCDRTERRELTDPLFLNAASQNGALFLTWNAAPNSRQVTLRCRRVGSDDWHESVQPDSRAFHLMDGLDNGAPYDCHAERESETGARITSHAVTQTPRSREFHVGPHYFASQQAADNWLKTARIDPATLNLRGQPLLAWGPDSPDGGYTNAGGDVLFILLRDLDETFHPPATVRSPAEVRTVLKRALWRTANPFDEPELFPMTVAPIEPPLVGDVKRFSTANSFLVAYHPQLSSRCTRFVPAHPSPGKFAVYNDGHVGPTVAVSARVIDGLLERGWQVIAMDMPLSGANEADQTATTRTHNSFFSWPTADVSPVALFLQPLKAIVDQIYRENGDPTIMLIGKSGGGWTSFMYGALDERVDYVAGIAAGMPRAQWVREQPTGPADYEQVEPMIYGAVRYEDIMPVAGSRGAFYAYNEHDNCCFRLRPGEPFLRYLQDAAVTLDKPIGVFVDRESRKHAFTDTTFAALDRFLEAAERGRQP
jgi:hypothetical protein